MQLRDPEFRKFIIKNTVIASTFVFLLGNQIRSFSSVLVDALVEPLFSIDLDRDGKPDLKQLDKFITRVFGLKIPIGRVIMELIKTIVTLLLIYCIIKILMRYTSIIKK